MDRPQLTREKIIHLCILYINEQKLALSEDQSRFLIDNPISPEEMEWFGEAFNFAATKFHELTEELKGIKKNRNN